MEIKHLYGKLNIFNNELYERHFHMKDNYAKYIHFQDRRGVAWVW